MVITYDREVDSQRQKVLIMQLSLRVVVWQAGCQVSGIVKDSPGSKTSLRQCVIQWCWLENSLTDQDVIVLASSGLSFWHLSWTQCNTTAWKWYYLGWLRRVFELNSHIVVKKENIRAMLIQPVPEGPSLYRLCLHMNVHYKHFFLYKYTDI